MTISGIKNLNITAILSEPFKHSSLQKSVILDALKERKGGDEVKNSGIEAPGLMVMMLPDDRKEFVFETNRILVNDRSEKSVETSEVVEDFFMLLSKKLLNTNLISSFGLNLDAVVDVSKDFNPTDLIGDKFSKIDNISSAGISINFTEGNERYTLDFKPLSEEGKLFAHFNVHLNKQIPDKDELKGLLQNKYNKFVELLSSI